MSSFTSPLNSPATWAFTLQPAAEIPTALRYAGYKAIGLRARLPGGSAFAPATGVIRKVASPDGTTVVELEVLPVTIRAIAQAIPGGLPTFYLIFDDVSGLTFSDGQLILAGDLLRTADALTIVAVSADRIQRDPALWAAQISTAITAGGGDDSAWQPFADAVAAGTATGPDAPVWVFTPQGTPLENGTLEVVIGAGPAETTYEVTLDPLDHGNLQAAVNRLHTGGTLPIANLWGAAGSARVRPSEAESDFQLVRLEDSRTGAGEIEVTPGLRHIAVTNLNNWFSPQRVARSALAQYTRGNLVRTFVNGPEFFDDFFALLKDAAVPGGGLHLSGWAIFPQTKFVRRVPGDDDAAKTTLARAKELIGADGVPLTLEHAASLITAAGGRCRFLPVQFIQLEPGAVGSTAALILIAEMLLGGLFALSASGVSFAKTDGSGTVLLMFAWTGASIYVSSIVDGGGRPLEANKDAVDILNAVHPESKCDFAAYPAMIADNPLAPAAGDLPLSVLFNLIQHFGVYHQKFAVVKTDADLIGYCGGVDLNPDRLDDANHLIKSPFHDVHTRIEGPAVKDMAITLDDRWRKDGSGAGPAFEVPPNPPNVKGNHIVQVARTYFRPADPARALPFAPLGDDTLVKTMIQAIGMAREFIYIEDQYFTPPAEYRDALHQKLASGELRKLIIAIPGLTDQPFGEVPRSSFIQELRAADPGGVVHIGYPRRRYTVAGNDVRSSSGRLLLMGPILASGGPSQLIPLAPKSRIPKPPFWLSIDGEIMYVYDEGAEFTGSPIPNPYPQQMRLMLADRGAASRFLTGRTPAAGSEPRAHEAGTAATVVEFSNIYVHAKMMIVDDVFLSVGSANLNRRGLFHDGEANVFVVPEQLKADPANPVAALRRRLWAQMLDLPEGIAGPLVQDPLSTAALFNRSSLAGNRYVEIEALPAHLMMNFTGSGSLLMDSLLLLGLTLTAAEQPTVFDALADPTSRLE